MDVDAQKIIDALTQQNAVLNREIIVRNIVIEQLQEELNKNGPDAGSNGSGTQAAVNEKNAGNAGRSGDARPVLSGQ